jgi:hypothetical protein
MAEELEATKRINDALYVAYSYGQIDGDHHKAWVIDQIVRKLTGENYTDWVKEFCKGEDGPDTYAWDKGIPP